jgi:hypothetical protein
VTSTSQIKEDFYLRRAFGDDAPAFIDATPYVRLGRPYPLVAKKALKATCGVWTDDQVVAFSLREFSARQAEREVETVGDAVGGTAVTRRQVLWPRMPRKTLQELGERARALSAVLGGDDVIAELEGDSHVLALTRTRGKGELTLTGRVSETAEGLVQERIKDTKAEVKLPLSGVRLRLFLHSPVRRRVLAYAFNGHLSLRPGELETVTRVVSLALNGVLGLAPFRVLSALDRVEVQPAAGHAGSRLRPSVEPVVFTVPVLLLTDGEVPAARGQVAGEIDLERLDPMTGGLGIRVSTGDRLEWNPAVVGSLRFETYRQVLTETLSDLVGASLGTGMLCDVLHDIALGELGPAAVAALRAAIADLPSLAATPAHGRFTIDHP